jgi:prepilin-type processing-associated H-X9-DG protein
MIELLVVFAVICVFVGVFIPAVQSAREASRRTHCTNNLANLSLALANHVNTMGALPPGVFDRGGPIRSEPVGFHHSWVVAVLPFVEQYGLYSTFDEGRSVYDPANARVRNAALSILMCQSDPGPKMGPGGIAESNYVGCHHHVEAPIAADNMGVLFLNSRIRYDDIYDGTGNTILLGEKLRTGQDLGWASGTRATLRNTGSRINAPDLRYGRAPIPVWNPDGSTGSGPPTQPDPKNVNLVGGFGSAHGGGANFVFGDGSVRFLSETIDRRVFQCLGNRADEEMVEVPRR